MGAVSMNWGVPLCGCPYHKSRIYPIVSYTIYQIKAAAFLETPTGSCGELKSQIAADFLGGGRLVTISWQLLWSLVESHGFLEFRQGAVDSRLFMLLCRREAASGFQ